MGVAGAPQGAITMCILAIFLGAILSEFAAAAMLKRFCADRRAGSRANRWRPPMHKAGMEIRRQFWAEMGCTLSGE